MVRKSDEYIFPKICRKNVVKSRKSSAKESENPCEAVRYAMHSSGKNSLAVGLSPYKIAKINAFASKLAGRYFHHFAWLVAFTKSSQKISTHLLTVLIMRAIVQIEQRKRDKRKDLPDVQRTLNDNTADWIFKIQRAFERRYDLC